MHTESLSGSILILKKQNTLIFGILGGEQDCWAGGGSSDRAKGEHTERMPLHCSLANAARTVDCLLSGSTRRSITFFHRDQHLSGYRSGNHWGDLRDHTVFRSPGHLHKILSQHSDQIFEPQKIAIITSARRQTHTHTAIDDYECKIY